MSNLLGLNYFKDASYLNTQKPTKLSKKGLKCFIFNDYRDFRLLHEENQKKTDPTRNDT